MNRGRGKIRGVVLGKLKEYERWKRSDREIYFYGYEIL